VHNEIVGGMGVPGVKAAMDLLGLHGGLPRAPLAPTPEAKLDEIRALLAAADLLAPAGV
jgi:4-hydroxy-2-oxoglutarate aldolase